MRPLLSQVILTGLVHGPEITVSVNAGGTVTGRRLPPKRRPHASTAEPAMALSRLIPRNKGLALALEGLVHITRIRHRRRFLLCFSGNCGAKFAKMYGKSKILYRAKDDLCFEPSRCHSKLASHQVRRSSFVQKNWGSICCVCIKYSNCLRRVNVRCSKTSFAMSIRLNRS